MPPAPDIVENSEILLDAVKHAALGSTIPIGGGVFYLEQSLVLDCSVSLQGAADNPACLIFIGPNAGLRVQADDCSLDNLILGSQRHRGAPLLHARDAAGLRVTNLALLNSQGRGMQAEDCRDLLLEGVAAAELGAEAVVIRSCAGVRIGAVCRGIGRAHRASAVIVEDCNDFLLRVDVADTSGSAVTIRGNERAAQRGELRVHARDCLRGLTVIGQREQPLTGLSGSVWVAGSAEYGVMLTNVHALKFEVFVNGAPTSPVLRLQGAYGARDCVLTLHGDDMDPVTVTDGRDSGTAILKGDAPATPPDDAVPPSLPNPMIAALIGTASEEGFDRYQVPGICSLCGWSGLFRRTVASERETLACGRCRAVLRYRGQADALLYVVGGGQYPTLADLAARGALKPLAIFEPGKTGPLRRYLSQSGTYCRSQYIPGLPSGTERDGLVCQDLMATSFADASFDLVVTSDIMEHVRKPMAAFQEIARILRPGGAHIFSIPFLIPVPEVTRARVDTSGPEDRYLLPPVYHGSGGGGLSLVYTDFGRDLGALLRQAGMELEVMRHTGRSERHIVAATMIARRVRPVDAMASGKTRNA
ncbi:class I SAM-dependent methyltransferase [Rhodopila sp.]|uniref:class I SAM-dependent methyltransferase n=1 Tax=Rhodopila sp. TaxID=2480087 RepID=UPI002D7E28BA|nr:methyltransferase domain-containing protein [Rhodopila sp.]